jgi:hypothetical protein
MSSLPAWVTYVSLSVSALALIVSALSALYTARSYSRAGVRVIVKADWHELIHNGTLTVAVTSSGLSEVTVRGISLGGKFHPLVVRVGSFPEGPLHMAQSYPIV